MLLERGVAGVAYETIAAPNGTLPLLTPMSEVAGRMAIHVGAFYLQKSERRPRRAARRACPGVPPADVVIIGGGVVGHQRGARSRPAWARDVTILETSASTACATSTTSSSGASRRIASNPDVTPSSEAAAGPDLLVGAVLIPGAAAPKLVSRGAASRR